MNGLISSQNIYAFGAINILDISKQMQLPIDNAHKILNREEKMVQLIMRITFWMHFVGNYLCKCESNIFALSLSNNFDCSYDFCMASARITHGMGSVVHVRATRSAAFSHYILHFLPNFSLPLRPLSPSHIFLENLISHIFETTILTDFFCRSFCLPDELCVKWRRHFWPKCKLEAIFFWKF